MSSQNLQPGGSLIRKEAAALQEDTVMMIQIPTYHALYPMCGASCEDCTHIPGTGWPEGALQNFSKNFLGSFFFHLFLLVGG